MKQENNITKAEVSNNESRGKTIQMKAMNIPDGLELHNSLLMHNLVGTQHDIRGSNYPSDQRYYECS
jgi:hypothetical protein